MLRCYAAVIVVAAEMNKLEALQELLRRGVDIHRQVGEGGSALMRAGNAHDSATARHCSSWVKFVSIYIRVFLVIVIYGQEPPAVQYVVHYAASTGFVSCYFL
jgi:hypothetical protein